MFRFNHITLMGRIVRAPVEMQSRSGRVYVMFSIAVQRMGSHVTHCDYFDVYAFRASHRRRILEYFDKGSPIIITGRMQACVRQDASYPDRKYKQWSVIMMSFDFAGVKAEHGANVDDLVECRYDEAAEEAANEE